MSKTTRFSYSAFDRTGKRIQFDKKCTLGTFHFVHSYIAHLMIFGEFLKNYSRHLVKHSVHLSFFLEHLVSESVCSTGWAPDETFRVISYHYRVGTIDLFIL